MTEQVSADDRRERYDAASLREFMRATLVALGCTPEDAAIGAEVLAYADLSGVDTHGIANFLGHWHYAPGLRDASVAPQPVISVLRESPVSASWDGGHGFGPVVAHRAMTEAIAKAKISGIGMITVRNACHFGAHGYIAEMAARHDMIGMTMSNTAPSAVAPGGLDKVVGTNPLGFAAPVQDGHPFVLDMATTAASGSRLLRAAGRGEPVAWGLVADERGEVTTDATAMYRGGSTLPLGSTAETGGFKGFGLGLVVDILSGVLSGNGSALHSTFGPQWQAGYWMAAWRIDAFVDPDQFKAQLSEELDLIRASRPAPGRGRVQVPGDRSAETRRIRAESGIVLDADVIERAHELARATNVAFPEPRPA